MDQTKQERPIWIKEVMRAARVGAVVAAVITVLGSIPIFIFTSGPNPTIWKILGILGSLVIVFLEYWIVCSILAVIVRSAAKGIARLLGRDAANLKQRNLHAVGVLEPHVMIAPGSNDWRMDQSRPMGEQALHGRLQVRNLKCKPDLPADASARFDLVDGLCLCFVENLQGGLAHIEDQRPALAVVPKLRRLDPESLTVEFYRSFIIAGGECDAQFKDGMVWGGHVRGEPFVN